MPTDVQPLVDLLPRREHRARPGRRVRIGDVPLVPDRAVVVLLHGLRAVGQQRAVGAEAFDVEVFGVAEVHQVVGDQLVLRIHQIDRAFDRRSRVDEREIGDQRGVGLVGIARPEPQATVAFDHRARRQPRGLGDRAAEGIVDASAAAVEGQAMVAAGDPPLREAPLAQRHEAMRTAIGDHRPEAILFAPDQPWPVEQPPRKEVVRRHLVRPSRHVPEVANELGHAFSPAKAVKR